MNGLLHNNLPVLTSLMDGLLLDNLPMLTSLMDRLRCNNLLLAVGEMYGQLHRIGSFQAANYKVPMPACQTDSASIAVARYIFHPGNGAIGQEGQRIPPVKRRAVTQAQRVALMVMRGWLHNGSVIIVGKLCIVPCSRKLKKLPSTRA